MLWKNDSSAIIVYVYVQPHIDFGMKVSGGDIMSVPGLYRFVQVIPCQSFADDISCYSSQRINDGGHLPPLFHFCAKFHIAMLSYDLGLPACKIILLIGISLHLTGFWTQSFAHVPSGLKRII